MVPLRKQNFSLIQHWIGWISPHQTSGQDLLFCSRALRKESNFQAKPCFPKHHRRSRPGLLGQWGARALLLMDWGFRLFQDFSFAKREQSIEVTNANGLFGTKFFNQQSPNHSLTSMHATQLPRFQSRATLLSLLSQSSTITQRS